MSFRQIRSLETMKRLEDQRLEVAAREHLKLASEIHRIDDEIGRLETEIMHQAGNTDHEFAPFLTAFIRAARAEIDRLKAHRNSLSQSAAELEDRLRARYRDSRMLESAAETLGRRMAKEAALVDAENDLDDLTRPKPIKEPRPC